MSAESLSVIRVNDVYGNTGNRYSPCLPTPWRSARWNSAWLQFPMPYCLSGVMLGARNVPNGVSSPRPPDGLALVPLPAWQPLQSLASNRYLPRATAAGSVAWAADIATTSPAQRVQRDNGWDVLMAEVLRETGLHRSGSTGHGRRECAASCVGRDGQASGCVVGLPVPACSATVL